MTDLLKAFQEHLVYFQQVKAIAPDVEQSAATLAAILQAGQKILICGNGGSAADAQHFAAELVGRFELERSAWPAIALTTDTSILSAIGNDYGFDAVFARQVDGLAIKGDALIGISTSGNSPNIIKAVESAKTKGMHTIGLLGRDGGKLGSIVDTALVIQGQNTARIQEVHIFILHLWAMLIEKKLTNKS
ncbi:MAG: D-sedoheptulose 7-phosphate isomerase [Desulfobacteraceae bacterium]|nr:D-sedoheptulose 7-phosphate isomerase [Desulfobacteraceae bacterium]